MLSIRPCWGFKNSALDEEISNKIPGKQQHPSRVVLDYGLHPCSRFDRAPAHASIIGQLTFLFQPSSLSWVSRAPDGDAKNEVAPFLRVFSSDVSVSTVSAISLSRSRAAKPKITPDGYRRPYVLLLCLRTYFSFAAAN